MKQLIVLAAATILGFAACSKDTAAVATPAVITDAATVVETVAAIAPAETDMVADLRGGGDGKAAGCKPIKVTDIGQVAKDYITKNYAGYTTLMASKRDSAGVVTYGVVVGKQTIPPTPPVVLIFDANWKFVKVAPVPPPHPDNDPKGTNNDPKNQVKPVVTSIALTAIPKSATDYAAANVAGYVVQGAVKAVDPKGVASYTLLLAKTGARPVALLFDANWKFVKRLG
jgi:hypothetical protein